MDTTTNALLSGFQANPLEHTSLVSILINIALGFLMGLVIAWTYRRTFQGFSYSRSFLFSLVFLTAISTLVIIAVGESVARAFALAGALSIVRFRTPIKDTKDITFIFYSLIVGLAMGTSKILEGVLSTLLISALILLYYKFSSDRSYFRKFIVRVVGPDTEKMAATISSQVKSNASELQLANVTFRTDLGMAQMTYIVSFREDHHGKDLADHLSKDPNIKEVVVNPLSDMVDY